METKNDYQEFNGVFYKKNIPLELVEVLDNCRQNDIRVIVDYGDTKTGKSWGEVYGICGYIGRSTGDIKIPLLVYNKRSSGGQALLDDCIISVKTSKGKKELYKLKIN